MLTHWRYCSLVLMLPLPLEQIPEKLPRVTPVIRKYNSYFSNKLAKQLRVHCWFFLSRESRPFTTAKIAHDDVIKWKHFLRYWPFVRGIHRPRWIPHTKPVTRSFGVLFDLRLNKRLSKQWWGGWFDTLSCPLRRHRNERSSDQHRLDIDTTGKCRIDI